jgi:hypothetical protein
VGEFTPYVKFDAGEWIEITGATISVPTAASVATIKVNITAGGSFSSIDFTKDSAPYWELDTFEDWGVEFLSGTETKITNNTGSDATARIRITAPTASAGGTGGGATTLAELTDSTTETTDPLITSNLAVGHFWINSTSGEAFVCTDATTNLNVWTNIGDGADNITPNNPPENPTNTTIAAQDHETSFNHIFTGGTDADGTVTHYLVDTLHSSLTVATAEVAAGSPHVFTIGTLTVDTPLTFRVRSKDNLGIYSSGVTISFQGLLVLATGGLVNNYTVGGVSYRSHTFLTSGTFSAPVSLSGVDIMIVAGGGGGGDGNANGGGGGAGAVLIGEASYAGGTLPAGDYNVTIGAGGAGLPSGDNSGGLGGDTYFGTIMATGGGYGGSYHTDAANGGSGGGGSGPTNYDSGGGFTSGSVGWNYNGSLYMSPHVSLGGSTATGATNQFGGGGGGAGGAGGQGSLGGNGGIGITNTFRDGTTMKYAGGGSGGRYFGSPLRTHDNTEWGGGRGSEWVGSSPNSEYASTRNGVANTGGGGGGSGDRVVVGEYSGGSGIVILRYVV